MVCGLMFLFSFSLVFVFPQMYGDMWAKLHRAIAIWSGFGMSLTGVHTCGDYMFSGHTVVITMLNFFVTECEWVTSFEQRRKKKLKFFVVKMFLFFFSLVVECLEIM